MVAPQQQVRQRSKRNPMNNSKRNGHERASSSTTNSSNSNSSTSSNSNNKTKNSSTSSGGQQQPSTKAPMMIARTTRLSLLSVAAAAVAVGVLVVAVILRQQQLQWATTTTTTSSANNGISHNDESDSLLSSSESVMLDSVVEDSEENTAPQQQQQQQQQQLHYQVLEVYPHDASAFTQGLVTTTTTTNGILYEGTGLHGQSELRRVDIRTGKVLQRHVMDPSFFGEGVAYFHHVHDPNNETNPSNNVGRLIQLTWKEQTAFIYDATTFQVLQQFSYSTTTNEGWGITYNPNQHEFIVSDGSEYLHVWDATTMKPKRKVATTMAISASHTTTGRTSTRHVPVEHLNELEWDTTDNTVLANIWYQDVIVRIDPKTGNVLRVYDFSTLRIHRKPGEDCFNGIALTGVPNEIYVTGKLWSEMYRVKLL